MGILRPKYLLYGYMEPLGKSRVALPLRLPHGRVECCRRGRPPHLRDAKGVRIPGDGRVLGLGFRGFGV